MIILVFSAMLLPLASAGLLLLVGRWPNLRETVTLLTAALLLLVMVQLPGHMAPVTLAQMAPGLSIAIHIEPLGYVFACLASFLWLVTSIYSIGYMRKHGEENQTRFYAWFAVAISACIGVAFAANMMTLFLFYEALTLATWPLVTHTQSDAAKRSGRIYLGILLGTSMLFLLTAIAAVWHINGTLDFKPGGVFAGPIDTAHLTLIYVLFVFGVGKAALMPFHQWLPAAMVAPTPVSALLHAVAVVKAGVFTILKGTVYLFGLDTLQVSGAADYLVPVATFTIVAASLIAMRKDNLKARLAYSTISQLSYIVLGAMLANVYGILAATLHMVMHAFAKITLFFCAGAIMVTEHKTNVSELRGIGRRMPFTMTAFLMGVLGIIGIPPMGAMWSKWYLVLGALEAQYWIAIAALILSSLLNISYLLPIPIRGFMGRSDDAAISEAPLACLLAIGITSVGCIALFFFAPSLLSFIEGIFP